MSSLILSAALSTFPYTSWVRLMILPAQIHSIASTNTHQTCVNSHPVNCIVVSFCITNRPSSNYLPILYGKRSLPPSSVFTLTGGSTPSLAWPLPAQTGLDLPATPSLGLACDAAAQLAKRCLPIHTCREYTLTGHNKTGLDTTYLSTPSHTCLASPRPDSPQTDAPSLALPA